VPEGTSVRVEFEYDDDYKVPRDAKAAVVAPSVVSDRYVQLTPVYRGGPVMADGTDIPLERTATPVELDRIFTSLNDLNVALGPGGANKDGALSRLLQVGADNLDGQGAKMNATFEDFSKAIQTLSDGRQDMFATVRNLQVFTTALAQNDQQVRSFNTNLASVADQLAAEREELSAALANLAVALGEVASFVRDNREDLSANIQGLAEITRVLVDQRDALEQVLEVGPTALSNLQLAYNPRSGTLDTRNNAQTPDPGALLCNVLKGLGRDEDCAKLVAGLEQMEKGEPPALPANPLGGSASRAPDLTLGGILGGSR
jgi:phospholipid/cholesterol/gamma-HCH transport system substrate-binding protein